MKPLVSMHIQTQVFYVETQDVCMVEAGFLAPTALMVLNTQTMLYNDIQH